MSVSEGSSTGRLVAVEGSSGRLWMVPELLRLAAARTDAFVAELRQMRAADRGMAPEDDAAVGVVEVARELRATYVAWVHGLDVIVNDARLSAARLAETAAATEARDREIADGLRSDLDPLVSGGIGTEPGTSTGTPAAGGEDHDGPASATPDRTGPGSHHPGSDRPGQDRPGGEGAGPAGAGTATPAVLPAAPAPGTPRRPASRRRAPARPGVPRSGPAHPAPPPATPTPAPAARSVPTPVPSSAPPLGPSAGEGSTHATAGAGSGPEAGSAVPGPRSPLLAPPDPTCPGYTPGAIEEALCPEPPAPGPGTPVALQVPGSGRGGRG